MSTPIEYMCIVRMGCAHNKYRNLIRPMILNNLARAHNEIIMKLFFSQILVIAGQDKLTQLHYITFSIHTNSMSLKLIHSFCYTHQPI